MRTRWIGTTFAFLLFLSVFAGLPFPRDDSPPKVDGRSPNARAGDVQGTVFLQIPTESAPAMLSPYSRRRYSPPAAMSHASSSPASVVVYVIVSGRSAVIGPDAVVRQRDRAIAPAVMAIQKGTRINFPNDDDVFHNLFSLSGPRPFNLGRYAPGKSRSVRFETAGVVRIFCDIHSDMSATVVVLDTPYHARPDENGRYLIRGVPEGRHTLVAWHETTGAITSQIVVPPRGVVRADIRVRG